MLVVFRTVLGLDVHALLRSGGWGRRDGGRGDGGREDEEAWLTVEGGPEAVCVRGACGGLSRRRLERLAVEGGKAVRCGDLAPGVWEGGGAGAAVQRREEEEEEEEGEGAALELGLPAVDCDGERRRVRAGDRVWWGGAAAAGGVAQVLDVFEGKGGVEGGVELRVELVDGRRGGPGERCPATAVRFLPEAEGGSMEEGIVLRDMEGKQAVYLRGDFVLAPGGGQVEGEERVVASVVGYGEDGDGPYLDLAVEGREGTARVRGSEVIGVAGSGVGRVSDEVERARGSECVSEP